jgi:uncharacterized protein
MRARESGRVEVGLAVPSFVSPLAELLRTAMEHPALLPLGLAALLGGLVRGFSGFGFAMVFVPLASAMVGPVAAVGLIWVIDAPFAFPLAARSLRRTDWREIMPLMAGTLVAMPLGVFLLTRLDRLTLRWTIAGVISCALVLLASGWRYRGTPHAAASLATGAVSGLFSGLASLGGMVLALFWLGASDKSATRTRDNLQSFFAVSTLISGVVLWLNGVLRDEIAALALLLALPYALGLMAGVRGFGVASEATFRRIAYAIIALSVVMALPLWDGLAGR